MKPYDDARPKGAQVEAMFDGIAPVYDRLNDIMSFGIARRWRRAVVNACANVKLEVRCDDNVTDTVPLRILDLATGTGDMAIALARRFPEAKITGADPSEGMLDIARKKAAKYVRHSVMSKRDLASERSFTVRVEMTNEDTDSVSSQTNSCCSAGIDFVTAEAERLPFGDEVFDMVTAAFGVRNFHDIQQGLSEIYRVSRKGGSVFILEFSTPHSRIFGSLYRFYFHRILPRIGAMLSKDRRAYTYLPDSVDEFPAPAKFTQMLREAGFNDVEARSLTGGVAYIYKGTRAC